MSSVQIPSVIPCGFPTVLNQPQCILGSIISETIHDSSTIVYLIIPQYWVVQSLWYDE